MNDYNLTFIKQEDFEKHVKNTLDSYGASLNAIDLQAFNNNVIDPIKLLFDKEVFRQTFDETIRQELQRQRDKHINNAIGYFHQNIFKYIKNCEVPREGGDVIYHGNTDVYVEMKNKHNTMNAASSQRTYMKMQNKILSDDKCICALVEVVAPRSRVIEWACSVDKTRMQNERIRRISIDYFYEMTTGVRNAFYQMCIQLPKTIKKMISEDAIKMVQEDTVIDELKKINPDMLTALYLLAFGTYEGFGSGQLYE